MRCRAFRARSRCCCIEIEGRRANEERDCSRSRSRDAPEEPTTCSTSSWGLLRKTLRLWQTNILARRPPGTRRTEYVFRLAELRGKSGKAQSKNSSFSPARHDATPGADVSIFSVLRTASRALCVVWRCHQRVAKFDRTQRSVGTLCVSAAEAPGSVERSKPTGTSCRRNHRPTASGRFPKGLWGLSELLSFKVRWQWCGGFVFFLRKEVEILLFELFL